MANEVVIEFNADVSGLQPALDFYHRLGKISDEDYEKINRLSAVASKNLTDGVNKAAESYQKLNKEVKEVGATFATKVVLDKSKEVVKTEAAVKSLKQQIREAVNETAALAQKFGELDPKTRAAAARAAELRERMDDVNKSISALNPEAKFNSLIQVVQGAGGAMTAAQGAMVLFGGESEDLQKTMVKLQAGLNLMMGLNGLLGMKDAFTNLRLALGLTSAATTAQTVAQGTMTTATVAGAAATNAATTSVRGLTSALLTNPITLAIVAVTALGAALFAMSDDAEEATKAMDDFVDANKELDEIISGFERKSGLYQQEVKNEINLLKARGAARQTVHEKELHLIDKEIAALRHKKNIVLSQGFDLTPEQEDQFKLALLKLQGDRDALIASFNKAEADKQKQFNDAKLNAQIAFSYEIRTLQAALISDEYESRKAMNQIAFDKELDELSKQLDKKLITLEQHAIKITLLKQKLDSDNAKVDAERDKKGKTTGVFGPSVEGFNEFNKQLKEADEVLERIKQIKDEIGNVLLAGISDVFQESINNSIESMEERASEEQRMLDERMEANQLARDNELISDREFRAKQKELIDQKTKAEQESQKKINDLKKKADLANRLQKLFEIGLGTSRNVIEQPGPAGVMIPYWIALGAVQAGAVLATPLPKYHTGRLAQNTAAEEMAIIRKDETVTSPEKSKAYHTTLAAIHHGQVPALALNNFVRSFSVKDFGRGKSSHTGIDEGRLASAIVWEMHKAGFKNVNVNGWGDLIKAVETSSDARYRI